MATFVTQVNLMPYHSLIPSRAVKQTSSFLRKHPSWSTAACFRRARIHCLKESPCSTTDEKEHTATLPRSAIPIHFRLPYVGLFIDNWILNQSNLDLSRKYGPIYRSDLVGVRVIVISDPLVITQCLKDTSTFQASGAFLSMVEKLFGKRVMFMSDGKDHIKKRVNVSPAFTMQMISGYFDKIESAAFFFWNQVETSVKDGVPFPLESLIGSHYIRIIVSITTGACIGKQTEKEMERDAKLGSYLKAMFHGSNSPPFGPIWNQAKHAKIEITCILRQLISERLKMYEDLIDAIREGSVKAHREIKNNKVDLLTILIAASELPTSKTQTQSVDNIVGVNKIDSANADMVENENGDEVDFIAELVLEIWFAGFFSNASATFSSLMEMEMNPEIVSALREEQAATFKLTADAVTKDMPLLHSFVLEVLRMHSPGFIWFRKTSKPTTLLNYSIPKGERLILDLWSAQRDPRYFTNPDQFSFRRFLPTNTTPSASTPKSMLHSFGATGGAHYCIGASLAKLSIKTTLAVLLRHYDLKLVPRKTLQYQTIPEFKPKDGIKAIHCHKRSYISPDQL